MLSPSSTGIESEAKLPLRPRLLWFDKTFCSRLWSLDLVGERGPELAARSSSWNTGILFEILSNMENGISRI